MKAQGEDVVHMNGKMGIRYRAIEPAKVCRSKTKYMVQTDMYSALLSGEQAENVADVSRDMAKFWCTVKVSRDRSIAR